MRDPIEGLISDSTSSIIDKAELVDSKVVDVLKDKVLGKGPAAYDRTYSQLDESLRNVLFLKYIMTDYEWVLYGIHKNIKIGG